MRSTRLIFGTLLAIGFASVARAADVEPLLPSTTEQVVHINVKQMLDSDIVKKFAMEEIKKALSDEKVKDILKEVGIDPLTDIDSVTLGFWGEDTQNMNTVGVVHGKFDAKKMFAAAEKYAKDAQDKLSIVEEGDFKLIKLTGNNDKPMYAAVADDKTIVVGTEKKFVAASLTASQKKAKPSLSKELTALVSKQDAKATLFACGMTEGKFKDANIPAAPIPGFDPDKLKDGLAKMNTVSLTVRLGKEINLDVAMGMKDADSADDFGATVSKLLDTVKTFLPLAAMNNEKIAPLIDEVTKTLASKVKDKEITLVIKVTADSISKATGKDDK